MNSIGAKSVRAKKDSDTASVVEVEDFAGISRSSETSLISSSSCDQRKTQDPKLTEEFRLPRECSPAESL